MGMTRFSGREWIEGALNRNFRRYSGDLVEINPCFIAKPEQESFEVPYSSKSGVRSRNPNWEIEADDSAILTTKLPANRRDQICMVLDAVWIAGCVSTVRF